MSSVASCYHPKALVGRGVCKPGSGMLTGGTGRAGMFLRACGLGLLIGGFPQGQLQGQGTELGSHLEKVFLERQLEGFPSCLFFSSQPARQTQEDYVTPTSSLQSCQQILIPPLQVMHMFVPDCCTILAQAHQLV